MFGGFFFIVNKESDTTAISMQNLPAEFSEIMIGGWNTFAVRTG